MIDRGTYLSGITTRSSIAFLAGLQPPPYTLFRRSGIVVWAYLDQRVGVDAVEVRDWKKERGSKRRLTLARRL